jgi:hypothetical protein
MSKDFYGWKFPGATPKPIAGFFSGFSLGSVFAEKIEFS